MGALKIYLFMLVMVFSGHLLAQNCSVEGELVQPQRLCCPGLSDIGGKCSSCTSINQAPTSSKPCCSGLSDVGGVCKCALMGETLSGSLSCCPGLQPKADPSGVNKCVDSNLIDHSLQTCTPGPGMTPVIGTTESIRNPRSNDCGAGLGCYEMQSDDMHANDPYRDDVLYTLDATQGQMGSWANRAQGELCYSNLHCESLYCAGMICQPKFVCRKAADDEFAPIGVDCQPGIQKMANGVCGSTEVPTYMPTVDTFEPEEGPKCSFKLDPEKDKEKIKVALLGMLTMRGMEVLFKKIDQDTSRDDCLIKLYPTLESAANKLLEARKKALQNFNQQWELLEKNQSLILSAKRDDPTPGEILGLKLTHHQINSRRTVGIDAYAIMLARAKVMQAFEMEMKIATNQLAETFKKLEDDMKKWSSSSKSWVINGETISGSDRQCRWGVWGISNRRLKNRWDRFYKISGSALGYFDSEEGKRILTKLSTIYLGSDLAADVRKTRGLLDEKMKYLVDPLLPDDGSSNYVFKNFGEKNNFLSSGDKRREIDGAQSFKDMREYFKKMVLKDLSELKPVTATSAFVIEPELATTVAKDCIAKPTNPYCPEFTKAVEEVTDMTFAQYLSWSAHHGHKYYSMYGNHTSFKMKLLAHYHGSLTNLEKYYADLSERYRTKQISCLQDAIDTIEKNYADASASGLEKSGKNYHEGTAARDDSSGTTTTNRTMSAQARKYMFDVDLATLKSLSGDSNLPLGMSPDQVQSRLASLSVKSNARLAARMRSISDANTKALAKGVEIPSAAKLTGLENLTQTMTGNALGATGAQGNSSQTAQMNSEVNPNDAKKDDQKTQSPTTNISAGFAAPAMGNPGLGLGSLSDTGTPSSVTPTYQDPTGMSDEEKSVIMANINRNRSKLARSEEDTLFEKVSKTYKDNLDKILTRKKAGQE